MNAKTRLRIFLAQRLEQTTELLRFELKGLGDVKKDGLTRLFIPPQMHQAMPLMHKRLCLFHTINEDNLGFIESVQAFMQRIANIDIGLCPCCRQGRLIVVASIVPKPMQCLATGSPL
jgi:hypothetical protein